MDSRACNRHELIIMLSLEKKNAALVLKIDTLLGEIGEQTFKHKELILTVHRLEIQIANHMET